MTYEIVADVPGGSRWEPPLRRIVIYALPLFLRPFLDPAPWSEKVTAGTLTAVLDCEHEGLILGKMASRESQDP